VPKGKAVYWLTGARLVSYKGSPAALVAYETPTEKSVFSLPPASLRLWQVEKKCALAVSHFTIGAAQTPR